MSALTDFLYNRINQLEARKKTIRESIGKKGVLLGKGFRQEDLPKIENDLEETETALQVIEGDGIPKKISDFIIWTHGYEEGDRWRFDSPNNVWIRDDYRNRTMNEHFEQYQKEFARKQRKNIPQKTSKNIPS